MHWWTTQNQDPENDPEECPHSRKQENHQNWWEESTVNQGSNDWIPCDPDDPDGTFYWELEGIYDWDGDLLVVRMLGHLLDLLDDLMGQREWIENLPSAATNQE